MKSLVESRKNFSLNLSNIYLKTECGQFFIVGCTSLVLNPPILLLQCENRDHSRRKALETQSHCKQNK